MKTRALSALLLGLVACAAPAGAQMPAPLPPEALREAVDPAKQAYLEAHRVADGPVTGGLAFRFPAAFYRSRLILLGESHGSAAPQVLDLELLTHLNRRIGLRDYLAEIDPVQAEHFNAFLNTGDEARLQRVFSFWKPSAQWGNTAFLAKVKAIRELNGGLARGRRIRFHGIDAIQDWPLLLDWMEGEGARPDRTAFDAETTASGKAALALGALAYVRSSPLRERVRAGLEQTAAKVRREPTIFANYARLVRSGELGGRPASACGGCSM